MQSGFVLELKFSCCSMTPCMRTNRFVYSENVLFRGEGESAILRQFSSH